MFLLSAKVQVSFAVKRKKIIFGGNKNNRKQKKREDTHNQAY